MNDGIEIVDVSPRDGIQNERNVLSADTRLKLIRQLEEAGVRSIEIGAFVNPKRVPQMANMPDICKQLDFESNIHYTALVPNLKGFELAIEAGMKHVRLVIVASETLHKANFNCTVSDSLNGFEQITQLSKSEGVGFGTIIGASFGCPYEGHMSPDQVIRIANQLVDFGADEVILADTTGMGMPDQVELLCGQVIKEAPIQKAGAKVGVHLHNTRNTGYANAYAAIKAGIRCFDSSTGGIGGCPFSPNALGNIATEDLTHMLNGMGIESGINISKIVSCAGWLEKRLDKTVPAMIGKAEPVYPKLSSRN